MRVNQWTDTAGNVWAVKVNTSLIEACRTQLQVEIVDVPDIFRRIATDVPLLAHVLYLASKNLADERKVSKEEFEDLIAGDIWEGAVKALSNAIVDFFPSSRRQILLGLLEKQDLVTQEGTAIGQRQIQNPKLDEALKTALQKAEADIEERWTKLGASSTSSVDTSV